ncbi:MAG: hypothetical protein OXB94_13145 [Nitrospira sp.]|nr:hypothetical protein [Nitrospira sp.]
MPIPSLPFHEIKLFSNRIILNFSPGSPINEINYPLHLKETDQKVDELVKEVHQAARNLADYLHERVPR